MNVIDFIPVGNERPTTREELVNLTGLEDRAVRNAIQNLKRDYPIVNNGNGYYIANDPDDPHLRAYIYKELSRIRAISKGLRRHKALYKTNKNQETMNL